jgi:hypothetical protein
MRCRLQRYSMVAIVGCECRCCAVKFLTAGSSDLASRAVYHQGYSSAALLHVVGGCSRTQLICMVCLFALVVRMSWFISRESWMICDMLLV